MRYALIKFRVYLLGEQSFAVYTDHASLQTAMKSPHLWQRMDHWLSFFLTYNFVVHYTPGKNNIPADALCRRPDYDPHEGLGYQVANVDDDEDDCAICIASGINPISTTPTLPLSDEIIAAYDDDPTYANIAKYLRSPSDVALGTLSKPKRNRIDRYQLDGDLLTYSVNSFDGSRAVVPNDADLHARIIHYFHYAPIRGHLVREKTYAALSRNFYCPPHVQVGTQVASYLRNLRKSQSVRVAPGPAASPSGHHGNLAFGILNFIFGLPPDATGRTDVLVFADRFSKMVYLVPVVVSITAAESAAHFVDVMFRNHGLPESTNSDPDPRFTSADWSRLFELLGTKLLMYTAAHPETDGQTDCVSSPRGCPPQLHNLIYELDRFPSPG
ncbi:hypothetical protein PI126_g5050 [Phytophthora idaei]|nr:hypothetical protein PI126_g5050 [Phytophthora idaei]